MTNTEVLPAPDTTEPMAPGEGISFEPVRRRGLLGQLSKGGIVLVGTLAGVMATSGEASAHGYHVACCHLAKSTKCSRGTACGLSNCTFCCPSGWTKRSWSCVAGTRPILCGECQKGGTNCWQADAYICSIAIDQNAC